MGTAAHLLSIEIGSLVSAEENYYSSLQYAALGSTGCHALSTFHR